MKAKEKKLSRTFFKIIFLWIALCLMFTPVFRPLSIDNMEKLAWPMNNWRYQGKWKIVETALLGEMRDGWTVDALIHAVRNHAARKVRRLAAEALGEIKGKRAADALNHALKNDADGGVRWEAAKALGEIKDKRAVKALIRVLENNDWFWDEIPDYRLGFRRKMAAEALGKIKDERAVDALNHVLNNDPNYEVRREAARALGKIKDQRAVDALLGMLKKQENKHRRIPKWKIIEGKRKKRSITINLFYEAIKALGEIGDSCAIAPLMEIFKNNKYSKNQVAAGVALLKMEVILLDEFIAMFRKESVYSVCREIKTMKNELAADVLADLLERTESSRDRKKIAKSLGDIGNSRAVEILTGMLRNEKEQDVLQQIIESLKKIKKESAADFFLGLLNEDAPDKRGGAAQALKAMDNSRAIIKPLFITWMKDGDEKVRQHARESLFHHIWAIVEAS